MAGRYQTTARTFARDQMYEAGEEVAIDGQPPPNCQPLDDEATQAVARAKLKRRVQRWLRLGERLLDQL